MKYKEQLRKLADNKEALLSGTNSSIILQANSENLGKNYYVAVYNRPKNFGCRLYSFAQDDIADILNYSSGPFANFYAGTQRIKGLLIELIDEDKEVFQTVEKRFDTAFLLTKDDGSNRRNVLSIQPAIMIRTADESNFPPTPEPDDIIVRSLSNGRVTDNKNLSIKIYANDGRLGQSFSVIDEKDSVFPFTIRPAASFNGSWARSNYRYNYEFDAKLTSTLQPATTYTVTIKRNDYLPNSIRGKTFTFRTNEAWQEKKQFVIPVEIEMPEEIIPFVKNIKASLLLGAEGKTNQLEFEL